MGPGSGPFVDFGLFNNQCQNTAGSQPVEIKAKSTLWPVATHSAAVRIGLFGWVVQSPCSSGTT